MSRIHTTILVSSLFAVVGLAPQVVSAGPQEDYNHVVDVAAQINQSYETAPAATPQASCLKGQSDNANSIAAEAADQIALFNDPSSTDSVKSAAAAQLGALAAASDGTVEVASTVCDQMAQAGDDPTDTDEDAPGTIPNLDPTAGLGSGTVPPPVDQGWPAVGSPSA